MAAIADSVSAPNVVSPPINNCGVCQSIGAKRCSGCNAVWYCSKEHQRSDWKLHKLHCTRLDKKINKHKSEKCDMHESGKTDNTDYDFVFVGENGGKQRIVYEGFAGKVMIAGAKRRAAQGDHDAIGMMYQLLRRHIDTSSNSEFTEKALQYQLNDMYGENVDFSALEEMQIVNTGGITPILS